MKPRIFIGSSKEGRESANLIKQELNDVADCQIWDEGFFEQNKSSFESLTEGSVLFDFAILVATLDDLQLKRNTIQEIARDNVIFEFGLYVGRLGRNRSFLLKEKGVSLPSDLSGITIYEFSLNDTEKGQSLNESCSDLKAQVLKYATLYELSFIPSTAIAIGYFENFISKVCRELMEAPKRVVNGKNHDSFILYIIIPDELPNNFNDQVISYLAIRKLIQMKVETNTRSYNFYLNVSETENSILELYDLPTTLSALKRSIEMAIPKYYVGESERERILKKKEMNNFYKTLEFLINENPITRNTVRIKFIDVKG